MKRNAEYQTSLFIEQTQKEIFRQIRNYLAGRFIGATRDRALLEEVVKCFFCKHYINTQQINVKNGGDGINLSKKYREVFGELKTKLPYIFDKTEEIQLDPASILFVDTELSKIDFKSLKRDPFGDLYEVFVSTGVREEEGQFFTPQNGIELLISMVKPMPGEKIIDPAAGAGGFLSSCVQYLLKKNVPIKEIIENIYGVEKDSYLAKLAATRIALLSLSESQIFCGDSLAWINEKDKPLELESDQFYDIVLTNPPFGKNIVATSKEVQKTFDLGYDWKFDSTKNTFTKNGKLQSSVPPQVLFVEKCINLLKEGGRLGMVVPESLITSKSYSYVVEFMRSKGQFEAIIGMPEDFFKTSGKGGTHTKACLIMFTKSQPKQDNGKMLFMAEAKWCGHDSRGKFIAQDDLPIIMENFKEYVGRKKLEQSKLGYILPYEEIEKNILSPRYYNPDVKFFLESIKDTHEIIRLGDLVDKKIIEIKTGNEVGKIAYGAGEVPFVRTSDISNWEIKLDPKQGISEETYKLFAKKQDVRESDILMVKDGTYLIGTCAIISKYDTKIVYQSHIYKIRVLDPKVISPYLLLAVLSADPVQQQIKSKRFTQDIIDSLGSRINDLILPIPKNKIIRKRIEDNIEKVIEDRIEARELARQACLDVASILIDS
ncbi:MAG: N-6 DNA methylase [Bacteroidales bacterium]|nr:N-6 DNA methylase [Bacteroidales bacterium]